MCDLGHGEAPGVLRMGIVDEDAEGLHQPVGREHLAARAERDHAPGEEQDLVVLHGLRDVVRGRDDGRAARQLRGEGIEVQLAPAGIDAGRGLVHHDEVGLSREHLREVDPLQLAAGEAAHGLARQAGHAHARHALLHQLVIAGAEAAEQAQRGIASHAHHVDDADGQDVAGGVELRVVGDPTRRLARIGAQHRQRAAHRSQQAHERADERRLARAIGAHQGQRAARAQLQVDAADHRGLAVAHGQVPGLDGGPGGGHLPSPGGGDSSEREARGHETVSPRLSMVTTCRLASRKLERAKMTKKALTATSTMVAPAATSNQYEMSRPT